MVPMSNPLSPRCRGQEFPQGGKVTLGFSEYGRSHVAIKPSSTIADAVYIIIANACTRLRSRCTAAAPIWDNTASARAATHFASSTLDSVVANRPERAAVIRCTALIRAD